MIDRRIPLFSRLCIRFRLELGFFIWKLEGECSGWGRSRVRACVTSSPSSLPYCCCCVFPAFPSVFHTFTYVSCKPADLIGVLLIVLIFQVPALLRPDKLLKFKICAWSQDVLCQFYGESIEFGIRTEDSMCELYELRSMSWDKENPLNWHI